MKSFRTVGLKLTLALAGLVTGALAIVYLAVVPSLHDRLVDNRLDQLTRTAPSALARIEATEVGFDLDLVLSVEAEELGARIVMFDFLRETPVYLRVVADSSAGAPLRADPVAQRAAEHRRNERGVVERGGVEFAEVALYLGDRVLLLAAPMDEDTIALVERRLLLAGVIALAAAALAGFALARIFARRIRRLERAAGRIASGHFDEPVVDPGADELGELAAAFDDMRKRLAALERARREFIANASHELRTPIFALGGHIELLSDDEMDEQTRGEFLEEMRLQVVRLTKLAADLLDLSRLDAGRLRVELAPVDLADIASSLVGEFTGVARDSEHALLAGGDGGALAVADDERVRQIGRILVENAIVHTPAGTEIRIDARATPNAAELRVKDSGPGIAPEDQAHVFDRFYRADGAIAAGSGLGLAIAGELASVMGGEIALESRPGRTVFVLRLPAAQVPSGGREPALAR
ncbi:MAG TPA: HAMP domain-containing sensor histidine kinase [Gaiellaceae bacterium]|nr:HAMP domain-containing sensor histidine kinase [Gaiellaceae bacterium]